MSVSAREMLERLRAEQNPARQRLNELRQQNQASPFALPTVPPTPSRGGMGGIREATAQPLKVSPEMQAAAQSGVDVTTGAPTGRFLSGFAQNEALQAQQLKRALTEHFGQEIQMRKGPQSGQLEFLNPQTGRFTTVNDAQISLRDVPGLAGPALPAVGAVAGEMFGGPVGAGLGGAAGEALRRGTGRALGVRDESVEDFAKGALGVGALEGGLSVGGNLAARGVQAGRNFLFPPAATPREAGRILSAAQSSQAVADEISRRTGQRFQPTTGQMSGDPALLGGETQVLNSRQTAEGMRAQLRQNETTLEAFFNQVNPTGAQPNTATGRAIQQEARRQTQPRVEAISEGVQRQIRELEDLTAALPRAKNQAIGGQLREVAAQGRTELKAVEDEAWNKAREAYGFNPDTATSQIKIPVQGSLRTTLGRLGVEGREALLPTQQAGKATLTPGTITGRDAAQRAANAALQSGATEEQAAQVFRKTLENHSLDLHQLNETISELRRLDRIARQNVVATDPTGRDRTRLLAALTTQRNEFLAQANPEVLAAIEAAEALTSKRANLFDKGLVGGMLRKTDGQYTITDPEVVGRTIGSGNPEAIQHLVTVFSEHPAGVPTLQRSMLAYYRNEVVENGIPNPAMHRRFIEQNGDALDALFPNDTRVRRLGEFERVVNQNVKRFEDFERAVNKSFRGRIQDLAPERIAERALSDTFSEKEVSRLMALADAAGVKGQYQQAVGDQIRRRFMSPTSGLQLNALDKFVQQQSDRLANIFGPEYVQDMRLLLSGLKTSRTSAGGIATTRNPTLIGSMAEAAARVTFARPLSAGGVGLTRLLTFRERAAERMLAQAIQDPRALHAIVAQGRKDVRSREVAQLLAVLGGSTLALGVEH